MTLLYVVKYRWYVSRTYLTLPGWWIPDHTYGTSHWTQNYCSVSVLQTKISKYKYTLIAVTFCISLANWKYLTKIFSYCSPHEVPWRSPPLVSVWVSTVLGETLMALLNLAISRRVNVLDIYEVQVLKPDWYRCIVIVSGYRAYNDRCLPPIPLWVGGEPLPADAFSCPRPRLGDNTTRPLSTNKSILIYSMWDEFKSFRYRGGDPLGDLSTVR